MKTNRRSESGQVMVFLAVAIVALLAFAALAIDVGMVYSDRRYDQSVADASALAGAQALAANMENSRVTHSGAGTGEAAFSCTAINNYKANNVDICTLNENSVNDPTARAAVLACKQAIARASTNHFTIDGNTSDGLGVQLTCATENKLTYVDKYIDIKTVISSTTSTSFMHLFYGGKLVNTVEATSRIRPRVRAEYGYAIVALKPDCSNPNDGTLNFNGNNTITINGGGLFANGCYGFSGTSLAVNVNGAVIAYAGSAPKIAGSPIINPSPNDTNTPIPFTPISEPSCSGLTARSVPTNQGNVFTIQPGIYAGGIGVKNNDVVTMAPGLYCLDNDFDIRGMIKLADNKLGSNEGVTIFMRAGMVNITAGGNTKLQAPRGSNNLPAVGGMLFYFRDSNPCNTSNQGCVEIEGNADTILRGTIYAPKGDVKLGGTPGATTGSATFGTQVIAYTATVGGNVTININFDDDDATPVPASLNMQK